MLAFGLTEFKTVLTRISWVDFVTLLFIVWGLFEGLRKGLEAEFPKFVELATANILVLHYYKPLSLRLSERLATPPTVLEIGVFVVILIVSVTFMRVLFKLLRIIVTVKFSQGIGKVGGGVFGISKYLILFSLLSYFLQILPFGFLTSAYTAERSWAGPFLLSASENFYRIWIRYLPLPQL